MTRTYLTPIQPIVVADEGAEQPLQSHGCRVGNQLRKEWHGRRRVAGISQAAAAAAAVVV
jgi:hypothetical protein